MVVECIVTVELPPASQPIRPGRLVALAWIGPIALGLLLALSACGTGTASAQPEVPGAVTLNQTPPKNVSFGGAGSGTVFIQGQSHGFSIGGLGVNGSAIAILQTTGEAYRLHNIGEFAGTYRKPIGGAVPPVQTSDGLWLGNENGIMMHLNVPPQGRMPDIGDDAVRIVVDQ